MFLLEANNSSAWQLDRAPMPLELDHTPLPHKILDGNDGNLNISILEGDVKLVAILEDMSDDSLSSVDDVTARGIGVFGAEH